jgi:hypothetical protein
LSYSSGDYVGIFPLNSADIVGKVADRLGVSLEEPVDLAEHVSLTSFPRSILAANKTYTYASHCCSF